MTRHEPPRLALAILERFVPENEPLAGDLIEAARGRSRLWFWRQVLLAVLVRTGSGLRDRRRATLETTLVGAAMLALLGFHAVVVASLINRLLIMSDPASLTRAADTHGGWRVPATVMFFILAVPTGRAMGRLHQTHRVASVMAFALSATTAAFVNLYFFTPAAALQPAFMPPGAAGQIAQSMVFIAGLFLGMASRPHRVPARAVALAVVAGSLLAAGRADAQDSSPKTFDVASIKRNLRSQQQGSGVAAPQPGGRYIGLGVTLRRLVEDAYGIDAVGGPAWTDSDRFDVNARIEGNHTPAQIRLLLRPLLADRFGLQVHAEPREMSVYLLVPARADGRLGARLQPSDAKCAEEARNFFSGPPGFPPPCGDYRLGATALAARGMTMDGLARVLSLRVGRPVLDRTGLTAAYDLQIEWTSDGGLLPFPRDTAGAAGLTPDGVSLFTALQEQLGLRLESSRAAVDVLVIDDAAPPTPD